MRVSWETELCIIFYILLQEKMPSLQFRVADEVPEITHSRVSLWSPTYGVVALEGVFMICDDNEDLPAFLLVSSCRKETIIVIRLALPLSILARSCCDYSLAACLWLSLPKGWVKLKSRVCTSQQRR